jgi:ribose 5-phosphate isomerase B
MKIVLGADHAGFALKQQLHAWLTDGKHEVEDLGTVSEESTDYPDFAVAVGRKVVELRQAGESALGLLVCGTGIGMSIAANKVRGVRAARCDEPYSARMARAHNDANVLCVGSRVIGAGIAAETLRAFLETPFEGGRHQRRVDKIGALDR